MEPTGRPKRPVPESNLRGTSGFHNANFPPPQGSSEDLQFVRNRGRHFRAFFRSGWSRLAGQSDRSRRQIRGGPLGSIMRISHAPKFSEDLQFMRNRGRHFHAFYSVRMEPTGRPKRPVPESNPRGTSKFHNADFPLLQVPVRTSNL